MASLLLSIAHDIWCLNSKLKFYWFLQYIVSDKWKKFGLGQCYKTFTAVSAKFLAFFAAATNSTNQTNKAGSMCH